jgi:hypothetical protein
MSDKRQKNQLVLAFTEEGRSEVRYEQLRQLGVRRDLAAQTAGSPHGPWPLAHSPALSCALPIAYFASLGLPRLWFSLLPHGCRNDFEGICR